MVDYKKTGADHQRKNNADDADPDGTLEKRNDSIDKQSERKDADKVDPYRCEDRWMK